MVWLARSARKRVNPCVITPNTLMPGRLCIVFSSSASLVFRGARLTVNLRLLAGQAARQQGDKKAGAPVLDNPRLDAILAAADAGCFATYIMKQGGVLVPRKYHLIRTAYEINEEPTAYGDHGIRIYGIWSPIVEGKICTHAVKWKMVRKAVDVQEAAADQALAPLDSWQ
ncbi:hypothetical protein LNO88_08570 [Klebsiella pneumoniae subsp. pneumoniae]|nr:hypothetical protein [Klebsiella pneumoniae subsp. pneumoniae]